MPKSEHGTLTIYTDVDTGGLSSGIKSITNSINKLSNSLKLTVGIAGFLTLAKSAVEAASNLQEYRNVAEVTFGSMIGKLDELLDVSIEAYGMSELMATQAASGFMAMGNAAGLAKEEASDMAVGLTEYMADFASFYNLSHERARTALAAVYTGETETLKQYGIMLQEVNLQQYENTYGLGRSIKTMTAAQKAQLRYNYILHVGADAIGDFARTSQNWANQTRVLSERWKEFLIMLGNGLITVLTPVVRVLNQLIDVTMRYTKTLGNSLAVIFGIEWQDLAEQQSSAANSAFDMAESEEAVAEATKNAAKSANKALQPFDKLNNLRSSSVVDATTPEIDTDNIEDGVDKVEESTGLIWSAIDSLYDLGQYLALSLQNTLDSIDWDKLYKKFEGFGEGLAEFLNGSLSVEALSSVSETLSNTLMAIVQGAISFGENLDWTALGESIAEAINKFFLTFDGEDLAEAVSVFVDGVRRVVVTAMRNIDWSEIVDDIAGFFREIEIDTIALVLGVVSIKHVGKLLIGELSTILSTQLATTVAAALGTTPVISAITAALGAIFGSTAAQSALVFMFPKTLSAVSGLSNAVSLFFKSVFGSKAAQSAWTFMFPSVAKLPGQIKEVIELTAGGAGTLKESVEAVFDTSSKAVGKIKEFSDKLSPFTKGAIGVASIATEFLVVSNAVEDLVTGTDDAYKSIFKIIGVSGLAGSALYLAFGPTGVALGAVAGMVGAIKGISDAVNQLVDEKLGNIILDALTPTDGTDIKEIIGGTVEELSDMANEFGTLKTESTQLESVRTNIGKVVSEISSIKTAMDDGVLSVEEGKARLDTAFSQLATLTSEKFTLIRTSLLSVLGEGGVVNKYLDSVGVDTNKVIGTIIDYTFENEEQAKKILQEMSELDVGSAKYRELEAELIRLSSDYDMVTGAVDKFNYAMDDIDWSSVLGEDGKIDDAKLERTFAQYTAAYENYVNTLGEAEQSIVAELNRMLRSGTLSPDDTTIIKNALSSIPTAFNNMESEALIQIINFRTMIQNDFIDGTKDVIDSATKEWSEFNLFERWFSGFNTKDDFVRQALLDYQTQFDAIDAKVLELMTQLGLDTSKMTADFNKEFIESLFKMVYDRTSVHKDVYYTLHSGYESMIDGLIKTSSEGGSSIANNLLQGLDNSLTQNSSTAFDSAGAVANGVLNRFRTELDIHSPSGATKEIGKFIIQGLNLGLTEEFPNTVLLIAELADKMVVSVRNSLTNVATVLSDVFSRLNIILTRETTYIMNSIENIIESSVKSINTSMSGLYGSLGTKSVRFSSSIDYSMFRVPALAQGAVIPPNKQFLAMLGDQKHGTNVEAPLDTIKQALIEAMQSINFGGDNGDIVIKIGEEEIFRAVRRQSDRYYDRTGQSAFNY